MEITKDIPTRAIITGNWCFVHYRGQTRTCFECVEEGHQRDKCPRKKTFAPPVVVEAAINDPPDRTVIAPIIEGLFAAVGEVESNDPPVDTAVTPVDEESDRSKTRSKSKKSGQRERSRS